MLTARRGVRSQPFSPGSASLSKKVSNDDPDDNTRLGGRWPVINRPNLWCFETIEEGVGVYKTSLIGRCRTSARNESDRKTGDNVCHIQIFQSIMFMGIKDLQMMLCLSCRPKRD